MQIVVREERSDKCFATETSNSVSKKRRSTRAGSVWSTLEYILLDSVYEQ